MKNKIIVYAVCILFVVSSLTASAEESDSVEFTSCHVESIEAKASCTTLLVPENWSEPGGKQISLFVAVIPPSGGQVSKAPLYILAGGPGQAASTLGRSVDAGLLRARRGREVVLLDQRGTGKSSPFECTISLSEDVKGDDFARDCLSNTSNQPQFYNSSAFMQDLDAVRAKLGHEQINLLGGSYGTRAALLYLRKYPQRVRSVILDAVAAPETAFFERFHVSASSALNKLFADCAADSDCRSTYPDLRNEFDQVLQSLASSTTVVHMPDPINVTPDVFLNALRNALYSPLGTAQLPFVIHAAAKGNFAPWTAAAGFMSGTFRELSIGTMLSVMCGEEVHSTTPEALRVLSEGGAFEFVSTDFWFDACSVWPHQIADDDYRDPVESSVPALLLSGMQDPVTPPEFGHTAASRLSNSAHIVAPYGGHTIGAYGCVPKLVATFLDDLDPAAINDDCLDELTREPFVLSAAGPKP